MKRLLNGLAIVTVAAAFGAGPVWADDEPTENMPGKIAVVKAGKLAKFIAKPPTGDTFALPGPTNDPTVEGGTLRLYDQGSTGYMSIDLPVQTAPLGWKGLGSPAGSKGYKYKGAGSVSDPCKVVLVKEKIVKAVCKGTAVDLDQPLEGELLAVLEIGSDSKKYCTSFGGTEIKNTDVLLKRKTATAPAACTCGAGNPGTFSFQNTPPTASDCGDLVTTSGASTDLECNGLYLGSGSATLTLPETVPDSNKALLMDVECCSGETLFLGPTTSTETADIETCTSQGCFFGAPLPLPNLTTSATSTCVFNTYLEDVVGEASCSDGSARLDMPLNSRTFLTGDILPRRCSGGTNPGLRCTTLGADPACTGGGTCVADPDIQPCPLCNPVTLVCNGGQNNGMACTPDGGENIAEPQFPTSHDCTVSTLALVGDLPVPFLLSTGTQSETAVPSGTKDRVFCGFCRDADGTNRFGECVAGSNLGAACSVPGDCGVGGVCGAAKPCESDADCVGDPQSREACEQRNEGAFGPNGGNVMTITEIGTPAGNLDDFGGHAGTMVSVFCIPPTFNPIIDNAADLPGPGAVSLPGILDVSSPSGAFVDGSSLF